MLSELILLSSPAILFCSSTRSLSIDKSTVGCLVFDLLTGGLPGKEGPPLGILVFYPVYDSLCLISFRSFLKFELRLLLDVEDDVDLNSA